MAKTGPRRLALPCLVWFGVIECRGCWLAGGQSCLGTSIRIAGLSWVLAHRTAIRLRHSAPAAAQPLMLIDWVQTAHNRAAKKSGWGFLCTENVNIEHLLPYAMVACKCSNRTIMKIIIVLLIIIIIISPSPYGDGFLCPTALLCWRRRNNKMASGRKKQIPT